MSKKQLFLKYLFVIEYSNLIIFKTLKLCVIKLVCKVSTEKLNDYVCNMFKLLNDFFKLIVNWSFLFIR